MESFALNHFEEVELLTVLVSRDDAHSGRSPDRADGGCFITVEVGCKCVGLLPMIPSNRRPYIRDSSTRGSGERRVVIH